MVLLQRMPRSTIEARRPVEKPRTFPAPTFYKMADDCSKEAVDIAAGVPTRASMGKQEMGTVISSEAKTPPGIVFPLSLHVDENEPSP